MNGWLLRNVQYRLVLGVSAWTIGIVNPTWAKGHPPSHHPKPPSLGCSAGDGVWSVLPASGAAPIGRSSPAVTASGRWIYSFGGSRDDVVTGEVTLLGELHKYDTQYHRWHRVRTGPTEPAPRAFAPMVEDPASRTLLLYGGATFGDFFSDFAALDDLWSLDPRTSRWTRLPNVGGPVGRAGSTIWVYDGKLYVFGGLSSSFETLNDLWVFDLTAGVWDELIPNGNPDAPPPRHDALSGGLVHDGIVTLYGGEHIDPALGFVTLSDTWQLDVPTLTWFDVTPEPASNLDPPRNVAAAAQLGDALYVHGGDIPGGEECGAVFAQNATRELWRFDLTQGEWKQVTPRGSRVPRLKRSRAVAVDATVYIFGGYDFTCENGVGVQTWNDAMFAYRPQSPKPPHRKK
jgi:N-acetylneuraminic acid mutarotase